MSRSGEKNQNDGGSQRRAESLAGRQFGKQSMRQTETTECGRTRDTGKHTLTLDSDKHAENTPSLDTHTQTHRENNMN